jgi:hypothetical protein
LSGGAQRPLSGEEFELPSANEWQDYGIIFEAGALGDWDFFLAGGFAGSAIKRKGIYYLYYQGASGYREVDDTVTGRAIGVALSLDGINFIKHENNPVITWQPNGNGEEGAVSSAAFRDHKKKIVFYYGANTEESSTTINADGRLAISKNGLNFRDKGKVLNHRSGKLWGSGDEIFPIIALQGADRSWYVYYIPNGTSQSRRLGVAWGPARKKLTASGAVRSGSQTIGVWGMGGSARVATDRFALFLNDVQKSRMEVRLVSVADPTRVTAPVERYTFEDFRQGTVLLDTKKNTWFLYYRNRDQTAYGLKLAPAGPVDTTGPTAPMNGRATRSNPGEVLISWNPSEDDETGVVHYEIFRDGAKLGTTRSLTFRDTSAPEHGRLSYRVRAINLHGTKSANEATIDLGR